MGWKEGRYGGITEPLQLKFDKSNAGNIQYEHITPLLRDLHWLPVRERIEFKLAVLVFHCLHGTAPPYLANELCRVADIDARRGMRSASTSALVTPSSRRSTVGDRAFFVAAPRIWNSLPSSVTMSETLGIFKRRLNDTSFCCFTQLTELH